MRPLFSRWINRFYWWRMERRWILGGGAYGSWWR